ncbi:MAG: hypothetical protein NZ898_11320 [Myxococcota bacterium]|nr:hypothetical protein [Myxococcota bacterium]MDW8362954.1 hypothetical protein [Myxococcales bacterium]
MIAPARIALVAWLTATSASACTLELEPPPAVLHARFDPVAGVLPMPNDLLRDAERGRLVPPLDRPDLSDAERELYAFLSTMDGWSTAQAASVELTGAVDPSSLDDDSLQVWLWGPTPRRVEGLRIRLSDADRRITLLPPREGWRRGATYVALLRGGEHGARGAHRERIVCDAAFYFLRLREKLDVPEHERAFPGRTRAERLQAAARLERARLALAPFFDFFEAQGVPRREVAALWSWTVTQRVELVMDAANRRMPLPFDLLLDPDTGLVDIPDDEASSELERDARRRLRELDGFALSADLHFALTGPVDPATVGDGTVQLYALGDVPRRLPAEVRLLADRVHVFVRPRELPLEAGARYALLVRDGLLDAEGRPVAPMIVGQLMKVAAPLQRDGRSALRALSDAEAARLEFARARVAPLLDTVGREGLVTAWAFTTMRVVERLEHARSAADRHGTRVDPRVDRRLGPIEALAEFPLAIGSLTEVEAVLHGSIEAPALLDPTSRALRPENEVERVEVPFTLALPRRGKDAPVPVAVFNHGIMTERRFVLALADALAREGFAAIAIDLPFHGSRTICVDDSPIALVDPRTGETTSLPPCEPGAHCDAMGRCVDASGRVRAFNRWPLLDYPVASGAAFLDVEHIPATRDHFLQAIADIGALVRSLRNGDWRTATGRALRSDRVWMVGQSLGAILTATYVPLDPHVERAVLNVPGADLVDMFDASPWFGPQVDGFFVRERIERDSFDGQRFLDIARWFVDTVDPQSVATRFASDRRPALIQMATADFIIPNDFTRLLERLTGLPRRDYLAEHAFLVIPVEPEYARGTREMARFLSGAWTP